MQQQRGRAAEEEQLVGRRADHAAGDRGGLRRRRRRRRKDAATRVPVVVVAAAADAAAAAARGQAPVPPEVVAIGQAAGQEASEERVRAVHHTGCRAAGDSGVRLLQDVQEAQLVASLEPAVIEYDSHS